jgi:hypothetical protein
VATLFEEQSQNLLPPADMAREIETLRESLRIQHDQNLRTLADFGGTGESLCIFDVGLK